MKAFWKLTVFVTVIVVTFVITFFLLNFSNTVFHWTISAINKPQATLPQIDTPPVSTEEAVKPEQHTLPLYKVPYVPTVDVLSNKASYISQSRKVLLSGDFDVAELHIVGNVIEPGQHYLFLVYGSISGILNGFRSGSDALDVNQTMKNRGVFTNEHPIDLAIDLMGSTSLATTRADFKSSGVAARSHSLWKENQHPPAVVNVLVVPLNAYGSYGGAAIKVDFVYQCSIGKSCDAEICPADKVATQCLKEKVGVEAAKDWCERAGFDGACDKIEYR